MNELRSHIFRPICFSGSSAPLPSAAAPGDLASGDIDIPLNLLVDDIKGNGSVTTSDIGQVKAQSGATTITANFRSDVNASGSINDSEIGQVKAQSGTSLP